MSRELCSACGVRKANCAKPACPWTPKRESEFRNCPKTGTACDYTDTPWAGTRFCRQCGYPEPRAVGEPK